MHKGILGEALLLGGCCSAKAVHAGKWWANGGQAARARCAKGPVCTSSSDLTLPSFIGLMRLDVSPRGFVAGGGFFGFLPAAK